MPRKTLEQLRAEMERAPITDEARRAQIDDLKQSVNEALEREQLHIVSLEKLEQALILFGDDHPDLAAAIRAAIQILSEGGV